MYHEPLYFSLDWIGQVVKKEIPGGFVDKRSGKRKCVEGEMEILSFCTS